MFGELILVSGFLVIGITSSIVFKYCNNHDRCTNNYSYPSSCRNNVYYTYCHNNNIISDDNITNDDNTVFYDDTPPPGYYE